MAAGGIKGVRTTMVLVLWLGAIGCGDDSPTDTGEPAPDLPPHQVDVDAMDTWFGLEASWPPGALDQARALIAPLRDVPSPLDEVDFYLRIAEAVALADNAHSNISRGAIYSRWGILPLRVFWFTDGLFVVRASPTHADLVGAEIVAIAGFEPQALMERMGAYYGGPDEFLQAYHVHSMLLSPALLNGAGVISTPDRVSITVRLSGGGEETVEVSEFPATAPFSLPWRYLNPAAIGGENGWETVHASPADVPWALQEPNRKFRYRFLEDLGVAHIQLRANRDIGGESITQFLSSASLMMATDNPQHIILDNRENDGGSLNNTAGWASGLHDRLPEGGIVYSLTSHATFSAGIYSAFFPEAAIPDRTVIVGTLVGDRPRFYAEGGGFSLPISGHGIRYSDLAHHMTEPCEASDCLFANGSSLDIEVGSLVPEVAGGFTFADFAAGRDPDVERVLDLIVR